jgi:hypothetical protein
VTPPEGTLKKPCFTAIGRTAVAGAIILLAPAFSCTFISRHLPSLPRSVPPRNYSREWARVPIYIARELTDFPVPPTSLIGLGAPVSAALAAMLANSTSSATRIGRGLQAIVSSPPTLRSYLSHRGSGQRTSAARLPVAWRHAQSILAIAPARYCNL